MALRLSKGLRNFLLQHGSLKQALQNGEIEVYSGAQPTTADDAVQGTLLCRYTTGGNARTAEVLATGTVTLTGGAAGSINSITVNGINIIPQGAVAFNSSLNQTAADLAAAINEGLSSPEYRATASGAVVTISALPGSGAGPNGFVVTGSLTTLTATYGNLAGGVTAANGLRLGSASAGTISKVAGDTWSGTAAATGTAGWFRFKGSVADAGSADATETYVRLDGAVATSGSDLNMSSTSITASAIQSISAFAVTEPAA